MLDKGSTLLVQCINPPTDDGFVLFNRHTTSSWSKRVMYTPPVACRAGSRLLIPAAIVLAADFIQIIEGIVDRDTPDAAETCFGAELPEFRLM